MALLNKILITLCALFLLVLALDIVAIGLLSSPDATNKTLEKSGAYSALAPSVAEVFIKEINSNNVGGEELVAAIRKAITPEVVESSLQPVVFALSDWLKQSNDTALPDLTIDMLPIKTALTTELSKALPSEQVDSVRFEITKSVPDTLKLSELSQSSTPSGVAKDNLDEPFRALKNSYQAANQYTFLIGAITIMLMILLGIINIRHGRKKLTSAGWAFLLAAVMAVVVCFGAPVIVSLFTPAGPAKNGSVDPATVMLGLSQVVSSALWPFVIIYSLIGVAVVILAHIIIHPKDKKH